MSKLNSLVNTNFKVLAYLYDNKDKEDLVKITQTEISQELNLNRGTVNKCFSSLIANGYLIHDETRVGRYFLTKEGVKTVELFRKSEKIGDKK